MPSSEEGAMNKPLTEVYICPLCTTVSTTPSRCYHMCDRDHGTERVRFVALANLDATLTRLDYLDRRVEQLRDALYRLERLSGTAMTLNDPARVAARDVMRDYGDEGLS
jgi:hypothetical protein